MFGTPFQGAKFRLIDGAVDEEPHVVVQQFLSPTRVGTG